MLLVLRFELLRRHSQVAFIWRLIQECAHLRRDNESLFYLFVLPSQLGLFLATLRGLPREYCVIVFDKCATRSIFSGRLLMRVCNFAVTLYLYCICLLFSTRIVPPFQVSRKTLPKSLYDLARRRWRQRQLTNM